MKKVLLAIFMVFFIPNLLAQQFELTPVGLRDKENLDNIYLIINIEKLSAAELYIKTVEYINEKYENPKEVIKGDIENKYLKFETHIEQFTKIRNSFAQIPISTTYITELKFKNGKIKYEYTSIDLNAGPYPVYWKSNGLNHFIWNKKDVLKDPRAKAYIQAYFNNEVKILKEYITNNSDDDW